MKRLCLIGLCLLFAAAAANATVLINDPMTTQPGSWVKVGNYDSATTLSISSSDGGHWKMQGSEGSGHSALYDMYYSQIFALDSGTYEVTASGMAKAWAGWWSNENWGWEQASIVEVLVDGVIVASQEASNASGYWDTWATLGYSDTVAINSTIEMRLHAIKGQNNNHDLSPIYWANRFNDTYLEVNLVPEPSSLLALFTGAAGLLGLVTRRRK